jgi:7-cyano-7-deazaguanine synthase in queuosine biosynthesis
MSTQKIALVTFSGGKDSSASAIKMAQAGYKIRLFTYQAGMPELTGPLGDSAPDIRHRELLAAFPDNIEKERVITGNTYLIRKLAIERTNSTHVVYPIALALAVNSNVILYCLKNNITEVVCGYSGYQGKEDRYIEQRHDFFELMKKFLAEYGLNLHAPVIEKNKKEVMDILEQYGVSSNSMENKSVFGGISFDVNKALNYWNDCLPICRKYIQDMQSRDTTDKTQ